MRIALFAVLFLLIVGVGSSQNTGASASDELSQRSSIPDELLRPRREEVARYPIDTVIGPLGQGRAPRDAYETARRAAAALLDGYINAPILSTVNRVFLEDCMRKLNSINPRLFRLGGGREEPDGSVSFLVRFTGREEGITGELFVRLEELRPSVISPVAAEIIEDDEMVNIFAEEGDVPELTEFADGPQDDEQIEMVEQDIQLTQAPSSNTSFERAWVFEDLIMEEARSREVENRESRHRFDFSPYERFY